MLQLNMHCLNLMRIFLATFTSNYSMPNCNFGHNRCLNNVMNYANTEILVTLQNYLLFKNTVY